MWFLLATFLAAAFSATIDCVSAQCDVDRVLRCQNNFVPNTSLKQTCRMAQVTLDCVKDAVKDCPDASSSSSFQEALNHTNQLMVKYGCSDLSASDADCDVSLLVQCAEGLSQASSLEEACRSTGEAIKCLTQQTRGCPDVLRSQAQDGIDQLSRERKDHGCSGTTVVFSMAVCLQLSGVAYFLSRFT